MADACPAYGPGDPLVSSLLGAVDCNVQTLIASGYGVLFDPSGAFAVVLTAVLTLYVGLIGYRLMLGRSPLTISDFALTAVKLGVVLALATQWGAYQQLVYHVLFHGPQQLADVILRAFDSNGSTRSGDVFDGLQRAFVDLTSFSPATPPGAAAPAAAPVIANPAGGGGPLSGSGGATTGALSTLLSKAGFDSLLLLTSAVVLLVSSLGVLLASKIVLGMLLATGPIFIALLLFDSTRGVFEGWLRASLAFAFAPLAVTLMLGVALTMLEPSLQQVEAMQSSNTYLPGVAFAVMVLVMVFAGVSIGAVVAAGVLAAGFRLPSARVAAAQTAPSAAAAGATVVIDEARAVPARTARIANALVAQGRREPAAAAAGSLVMAAMTGGAERRTITAATVERGSRDIAVPSRLGQASRRNASPREVRRGSRSE
jgi:type IV secretion system protein VirB6